MELEVSCNNVGKCPWIGHLSELVAHQNLCYKTLKISEDNKKNMLKLFLKDFHLIMLQLQKMEKILIIYSVRVNIKIIIELNLI